MVPITFEGKIPNILEIVDNQSNHLENCRLD